MPKAKTTATKKAAPAKRAPRRRTKPKELRPGRADVMSAAMWLAENTNLMPVLWGPTAVGKTYSVRQLAEERGAKLIVILLQQETPDEIAGYQVYAHDKLIAQTPHWFTEMEEYFVENPDGEVILFFDELDKAHDENKGALYTFIRDRHLRGRRATGRVLLVGACNPGHFPPGWESRVCFLHFPATKESLVEIASGSSIAEFVAGRISAVALDKTTASELDNSPPPSPKVVDAAAISLMRLLGTVGFYRLSSEAQSLVISAKLPMYDAEGLMRHMTEAAGLDAEALVRNPDIMTEVLGSLDVPQAVSLAVSALLAVPGLPADQDKIDALLAILDPFMADVAKLEPYYEHAKPEEVLQKLTEIDVKRFADVIKQSKRLFISKDKMAGTWIDELFRQLEEQKKQGKGGD